MTVAAKQNGQQGNGRTAGKVRPVNPFAAQVAALRRVVFEVVTAEVVRRVMERLCALAERGHLPAVRLLLSFVGGRLDRPIEGYYQEPEGPPDEPPPEPALAPEAEVPKAEEPVKENRHDQQLKRLHESGAFD